jgi:hypothetical protein
MPGDLIMRTRYWILLALCITVTACASSSKRERDEDALARYMDNAGEPVEQFSYLGRFDGWRALGRDKVVVWTGVNDAYLLTVQTPCSELPFANSIALSGTTGTIHRGFDSVKFGRNQQCRIMEIRPVDYRKVRQIERDGG